MAATDDDLSLVSTASTASSSIATAFARKRQGTTSYGTTHPFVYSSLLPSWSHGTSPGAPTSVLHVPRTPITSYGVIVCRMTAAPAPKRTYLMICRKSSFGYTDFMRGKYSLSDIPHIRMLLHEMSNEERQRLLTHSFQSLCADFWQLPFLKPPSPSTRCRSFEGSGIDAATMAWLSSSLENDSVAVDTVAADGDADMGADGDADTDAESSFRASAFCPPASFNSYKFDALRHGVRIGPHTYTLSDLVNECVADWREPEWEFPKGRRNPRERDYECALREFEEETGLDRRYLLLLDNAAPVEEQFLGSNHKHYCHKYYLALWNDVLATSENVSMQQFQASEVSRMAWMDVQECLDHIRPYMHEKRQLIQQVDQLLACCTPVQLG